MLSCFENEQEKKDLVAKNHYLNQNSVTVLIPISLWNGKVGEKIREKFAAPIVGLHDCEAVFTLLPIHTNYFTSDAKASRNILIVSSSFKEQTTHVKNKYAKNQHIYTIQGKNEAVLLQQLQKSSKEIMNTFYNSELNLFLAKNKINTKLQNQI